jgi:hypothetical protein
MLEAPKPTEGVRVSDPPPVEGWAELLLALPEFILPDAQIDEHDELVAVVEPPRDVQPCTRCGVIDRHLVHDRRWHNIRHLPGRTSVPDPVAQAVADLQLHAHRGRGHKNDPLVRLRR